MKALIIFLSVLALNAKFSTALECMGCEINGESKKCGFFYKCKKGIDMCETIVSKVDGEYQITMACATKDKCGHDSVYQEGLEQCKHKE